MMVSSALNRDSLSGANGLYDNFRDSHLHDLLSKSRTAQVSLSLRMTCKVKKHTGYDRQV